MHKIYSLIDPNTNKVRYIGFTELTLNKRLNYHLKEAKNPKSNPTHKINWLRKLLKENKIPLIILIEETENYIEKEIFWISEYIKNGEELTNGTTGGDGRKGPLPESAKKKLSEINKGKSPTLETREKISKANKGREFSEDHKQKLRKPKSIETRKRMSESRKGNSLSSKTKEKISQKLKGRIFPGQLDQLSKARENRKLKEVEQYNKNLDLLKIYPSSQEAEKITGIKSNLIRDTCNGNQKTAGGFIWRYKNI